MYVRHEYNVRIFRKMFVLNNTEWTSEWCPFEHVNVGHEMTKETSPIYACFPAAPPEMEIEVPCPTNSTVYALKPAIPRVRHLTVKCQKNGTWAPFEGNCGCYIQNDISQNDISQFDIFDSQNDIPLIFKMIYLRIIAT